MLNNLYSLSTKSLWLSPIKVFAFWNLDLTRCIWIILLATTNGWMTTYSEREHEFTFAICRHPSVCRLLSLMFVHPTQAIEIFGNVSTPFGTLAICDPWIKILRRSSQGNPLVGGLNRRGVEKCNDFGPFHSYISETAQDRR